MFYLTRVLTARERQLIDKLALYPRYSALVAKLTQQEPSPAVRQPVAKPTGKHTSKAD